MIARLAATFLAMGTLLADAEPDAAKPSQFYFVPLPEDLVFTQTFEKVQKKHSRAPVHSMTAIAVSTEGTQIWYDHHEDGFEEVMTHPQQKTTEIWGDKDAKNGCAPGVDPCTNSNDVLKAGQTILLENSIDVPRDIKDIKYDGGDHIGTSFPVAVTRAQYPSSPGVYLAGGVEVFDTSLWGTSFEAPMGENLSHPSFRFAYEHTVIYFQAGTEGADLKLPGNQKVSLSRGQTHAVHVNAGDKISSSNPVQAFLLTGDVGSTFEMRWYALIDIDKWTNDYYSPVGDTRGQTRLIAYNPNDSQIILNYDYLSEGKLKKGTLVLDPKATFLTPDYIPDDSGAHIWSQGKDKFYAVSNTDTTQKTYGQYWDWGFPLIPSDKLSPQILVAWGYGCTKNNCNEKGRLNPRSVVFVTALEDATLYIDYDNDKKIDDEVPIKYLGSVRVIDSDDTDMTGAVMYAKNKDGDFVDLAAAWGQYAGVAEGSDKSAQDLGTVMAPFKLIHTSSRGQMVGDGTCDQTGTMRITIRMINTGPADMDPEKILVKNPIPESTTYVLGSTRYKDDKEDTVIPDNRKGDCPLVAGRKNLRTIKAVNGIAEFSFDVKLNGIDPKSVVSAGSASRSGKTPDEYKADVICDPTGRVEGLPPLPQPSGASC